MKNLPLMYLDAKPPKLCTMVSCWYILHMVFNADLLDLVEDNATRLVYPEQTHGQGNQGQSNQQLPVGAWEAKDVMVTDTLRGVAPDSLNFWDLLLLRLLFQRRRGPGGGRRHARRGPARSS